MNSLQKQLSNPATTVFHAASCWRLCPAALFASVILLLPLSGFAAVWPFPMESEALVVESFKEPGGAAQSANPSDPVERVHAVVARLVIAEKSGNLEECDRGYGRARRQFQGSIVDAAFGAYLVRRGRWEQAIELLNPIVESDASEQTDFARYWRARAFEASGRQSRSELEFRDLVARAQRPSASTMLLFVAGSAAERIGRFQAANDLYRRALEAEEDSVQVRSAWAQLFAAKFRNDEALRLLKEAEELSPFDPELQGQLAWFFAAGIGDADKAFEHATLSLEQNGREPGAHMANARLQLDAKNYQHVVDELSSLADDYPLRKELLYLSAAAEYLEGDMDAFHALEQKALARNPRDAEFYYVVSEAAARVFRYPEALSLSETAVMRNPEFAPAYLSAAFGYSRTANDEKTLEYLRLAFDKDPYNVLAYNMVNLWEQTFEHYQQLDDSEIDGLRYRFANREFDVLSVLVPPVVRGAWREYKERYGFEPEPPVSFEVFSDSESFGIRSVGLPNIGLHGVCFGHVVTARSPSEGNFNYRIVYEHELSHVFTLQYSNYRIPRWLSEGIAEYDTYQTNESWRRTEDIALLKRLQEDELTSVEDLDLNFLRARSGGDMIAAYFQSFMTTRFIAERLGGREGLLSLLDAFRAGRQTAGAIEQAFEMEVPAFDAAFKDWLEGEYDHLIGNFEPDLNVWADQHGGGRARAARGDAARALLAGDAPRIDAAIAAFEEATGSGSAEMHFLRGVRAQRRTNTDVAIDEFESALRLADTPSHSLSMRVARMLLEVGNPSVALQHLANAADAYPKGAEPYVMMAQIHETMGAEVQAVAAWKAAFERDPNHFDAAFETATAFQRSADREAAIQAAERATNIRPFSGEALRLSIELLEAAGRVDAVERARSALREVEAATSVGR